MGAISLERAAWLERNVLPHEPALRAWLRHRCADLDIDDIVQETYAVLAEARQVDNILDPKSYAFQVAHSIVLIHLRRARIVAMQTFSDVDVLRLAAETPSPEQAAIGHEELSRVVKIIGELPPKAREVFLLSRVDGLSQKAIAERLNISENTVEKHIGKGIRLLMDAFGRLATPAAQKADEEESVKRVGGLQ